MKALDKINELMSYQILSNEDIDRLIKLLQQSSIDEILKLPQLVKANLKELIITIINHNSTNSFSIILTKQEINMLEIILKDI